MKITSLYCSGCSCEVPVDHFRSGECPAPPAPLAWLLGIQKGLESDTAHAGNNLTATRLAACPRRTGIEDNLDIPNLNLEAFNAVTWGKAIHAFLADNAPEGTQPEIELSGTLFAGTPYEIEVKGTTADLLAPSVIVDYKLHGTFSQQAKWNKRAERQLENDIQVSVYKLLAPETIERGGIWNGAMTARGAKFPAWFQVPIRFMTEAEILSARPFEGQRTVGEHILIWKKFLADMKTMPIEQAVGKIPLVGAEQAAFVCDYCAVEPICSKMARGM